MIHYRSLTSNEMIFPQHLLYATNRNTEKLRVQHKMALALFKITLYSLQLINLILFWY